MKFIWDKRKNEINIEKHELDFADAYKVFESPMLTGMDNREDYGEDRWMGIGLMDSRVVIIVFTEPEQDTIRVISFRKATTDERKKYEQEYKNQFGSL
ncbi:MAG: BrnT family toxin [Chloroflexi bacterium]|nr:BrnT family toxin [Chloroflexota bacterium]